MLLSLVLLACGGSSELDAPAAPPQPWPLTNITDVGPGADGAPEPDAIVPTPITFEGRPPADLALRCGDVVGLVTPDGDGTATLSTTSPDCRLEGTVRGVLRQWSLGALGEPLTCGPPPDEAPDATSLACTPDGTDTEPPPDGDETVEGEPAAE